MIRRMYLKIFRKTYQQKTYLITYIKYHKIRSLLHIHTCLISLACCFLRVSPTSPSTLGCVAPLKLGENIHPREPSELEFCRRESGNPYLVGGFNPFEKISQIGSFPQVGLKIKNI